MGRIIYFVVLAIANLFGIWFVLSSLEIIPIWIYALLLMSAVMMDAVALVWSLGHLKDDGFLTEKVIKAFWFAVQIIHLLALVFFTTSFAGGTWVLISIVLLIWLRSRAEAFDKLLDLRYW